MKKYVASALVMGLMVVATKQAVAVNRCELIQNKIQQRVQNYNTRKDNHLEVYQKLHDRLVLIADKLEDKGLTVTTLRTDLAKLQEMITEAKTAYEAFTAKVEATKITDCENAKVEYKGLLTDSREELQNFRQKAREIHNFIQNTIRNDLRNLKISQKND